MGAGTLRCSSRLRVPTISALAGRPVGSQPLLLTSCGWEGSRPPGGRCQGHLVSRAQVTEGVPKTRAAARGVRAGIRACRRPGAATEGAHLKGPGTRHRPRPAPPRPACQYTSQCLQQHSSGLPGSALTGTGRTLAPVPQALPIPSSQAKGRTQHHPWDLCASITKATLQPLSPVLPAGSSPPPNPQRPTTPPPGSLHPE